MTKKFGIIGCGMISSFHAKAIEAAEGRLVAQVKLKSPMVTRLGGGR